MSYKAVYSVALVEYTDSAPNYTFEVPSANTAVIREITAYCALGGVALGVAIQSEEGAPALTVAYMDLAGVSSYQQWSGRVVVPPAGIITLSVTAVDLETDIYVGGYLLTNVVS